MKLLSVLGLLGCAAVAATNPQLGKVQSVYILSMNSGMDQYLANKLTSMGVFQVVTDPQKADTLLTDGLGKGFEDKVKELYPPPPPPAAKKAEEKEKDKASDKDSDTKDADKDTFADKEKDSKTGSSSKKTFQDLPPVQT